MTAQPLRPSATNRPPAGLPRRRLAGMLAGALALAVAAAPAVATEWAANPARAANAGPGTALDGVVEAVRQTVVAAQVPGAIVQLDVKVGDRVTAGQVLLRLDARAAEQGTAASEAQVLAARASLDLASKDLERQRQLFQKSFISQAALERAEAEFRATQAQVNAQLAQAGVARTQGSLHVVRAPFAGVVAEVPVALGDMAMPGRPLLTLYDPAAMRVTAAVPQTLAQRLAPDAVPRVEIPGLAGAARWVQPLRATLLPTVDPTTHTAQLRADLPGGLAGVVPGLYVRVWLSAPREGAAALTVPRQAIVRRAELTAVYVLDAAGKPALRQVRLGRADGDRVEVLSGLMPAERVVEDPQAAARVAVAPAR